jgi:3-isopropylmalate/(R)-2-methylmalate dehydratase small subunit
MFNELESDQEYRLSIDLENQVVSHANGFETGFEIEEFYKYCLLNGFDDIGLTMQHADDIKAFEQQYYTELPWLK